MKTTQIILKNTKSSLIDIIMFENISVMKLAKSDIVVVIYTLRK